MEIGKLASFLEFLNAVDPYLANNATISLQNESLIIGGTTNEERDRIREIYRKWEIKINVKKENS